MKVVKVILAKEWHNIEAGSEINVDEGRAEWLREHGYLKLKSKPKRRTK